MVNQYTDQIIDMFVQEYTPKQICEELNLCQQSASSEQGSHTNDIPPINQLSAIVEEEPEVEENEVDTEEHNVQARIFFQKK